MKKLTIKLFAAVLFIICGNSNLFAQANIMASPNQGCAPLAVTFTAFNLNVNAYRVEWYFNDGSPIMYDTLPFSPSVMHTYNNPGNYNGIKLSVFGVSNNFLENVFYYNNIPVNGISINTYDTVCLSEMSNFCVNGNQVNSISWSFDDGTSSNQYCTNHAFSTTGPHFVTLSANSQQCGFKTVTKTIYVTNSAYPHPSASANHNTSCIGVPISFNTGTYSSYLWNFGDNSASSTLQNPQHTYSVNGSYTATLTVTNSCGKTGTAATMVNISNNPAFPTYPDFRLQGPSIACPNSNVGFNAPYGYSSYEWHFGDGTVVTTNNNFNNHTYGTALNTYTVYVRITSQCGNDTILISPLTVSNVVPWPTQNFNLGVNSPSCPNSNVGFHAPEGYNIYEWNFGDGSPLTTTNENNTNHFYGNVTGTKVVSVKITSPCGNDTTLTYVLVISTSAPFPNQSWFKLEAGPIPACPNDNVHFKAPGGYSQYVWNFNDGSLPTTTSQNENNHSYTSIGTHTASVTITNGCNQDTVLYTTILIQSTGNYPTQSQWFNLKSNSPSCPNSNVGFEAPGGYNMYQWNFGDGSPLVSSNNSHYNHTYGSALQQYIVSVKITNGCGHDTTLYTTLEINSNVGFPSDSKFKVEGGPNPSCPGDQVNLNAPGGYSNYFWTFGDGATATSSQNHAGHVYSAVNNYTYSVKITNACGNDTTLFGTINVGISGSFYSGLSIESDHNEACASDLIRFRVNQNGFQSYFWNFGDGNMLTTTGSEIQHSFSAVGPYTVSCKVKNGCGDSVIIYTTVQITNNSPVSANLSVTGIQNPSCPGDKVYFTLNDGQTTTKYFWNYGDGSSIDSTIGVGSDHIYTSVGNYPVSVTAVNACGMTKTVMVTQVISSGTTMPSLIGQDGKKNWGYPGGEGDNTTAGCAGDAIIFYFMGSAANNVWDFGDGNTSTATEQMVVDGGDGAFPVTIVKHVFTFNGPYTLHLTITNNCGNSVTDSMKINIGGNQIVNGEMTTSPPPFTTCAPIDFLAFGGSNYTWNFGDNTTLSSSSPTVSHTFSTQGVYVVTVLVTNGCGNTATYSKSVNVNGAGGPAITISSSMNPTCVGGDNGMASVSVMNGQEPYTYLWNDLNAQTSSSVSGLSAGVYSVTVTDDIGCSSVLQVAISNPLPMMLSTSSTPSACGSSTGSATVSVTGGTTPYSYLWTNGSTSISSTGLSYGLHHVLVTDNNGCTAPAIASVSEQNTATVSLNTSTPISCNGGSTGALSVTVSGGTSPFSYLWSNGATTQNLNNIPAGDYSLVLTDNGGCKASFIGTVEQNDSLSLATSTVVAPTCGNFDGSATVSVTGGSSPYMYLWDSGTNSTTATVSGLPAGTYTVTVTDANACSNTKEVELSNSNAPDITAVLTDVSCYGAGNGSINVTVTGGTSPYLYNWSVAPPQTNHQDLNTLSPGNYLLFVNDAQGCTSVRNYTISQPAVLTASITNTGSTCSSNNGTASAIITGGNKTFTYLWTGGQTNETATALGVGSYTVTVTDNRGCIATASTTISQTTPTPAICMVTVDELSVNNIVYWDKTPYMNVDSFIVYREVSTSLYKKIGAVDYNSLSEFVDSTRNVGPANGDPNVGAYRYKLQILDLCGDSSALSPYHNTIYIAGPDNNGTFNWGLPYAIEGGDPNIANYNLICQYQGTPWFSVGAVSGTQSSVTDATFLTNSNQPLVEWRVKTDWTTSCDPTRASINTSRSNIKHPGVITNVSAETFNLGINLYPNPAKDNLTVELSFLTKNAQLRIINVLGQTVFSEIVIASTGKTTKQINTSNLSKGIYSVVIESNSTKVIKKLVVN